jgi:hypothetical protein
MLKRLFIKLPLYILFLISILTIIIPLGYWLITGEDYTNIIDKIENL